MGFRNSLTHTLTFTSVVRRGGGKKKKKKRV